MSSSRYLATLLYRCETLRLQHTRVLANKPPTDSSLGIDRTQYDGQSRRAKALEPLSFDTVLSQDESLRVKCGRALRGQIWFSIFSYSCCSISYFSICRDTKQILSGRMTCVEERVGRFDRWIHGAYRDFMFLYHRISPHVC